MKAQAFVLAILLVACGNDSDTTPSSGGKGGSDAGGKAGSGGTASGGKGGTGGKGGSAGSAGSGATGGTAGASGGSGGAVSFIDTYDGIHAFLTFDYKVTDAATAASHADYVWGASESLISGYRASSKPNIVLSKYIPFTRDPDGTHDFAYWQSAHPDWVLYQCDQTTPAYEFGDTNVSLDITNPAVVDWQVSQYAVPAAAAGYDMIAADNFTLSNAFGACGIFENGTWKALYSGNDDPKYTADVLAWAENFATKLHALSPKPLGLVPNFSLGGLAYDDANVTKLVSAVDAVLDEGGFTQYASGFPSESDWLNLQKFIESMQAQNKAYFSLNEFNASPPLPNADVQWALASYLMSKEHASAVFTSGIQQYGSDNWRDEYAAAVGTPCGAMQSTQGVYAREYKHGYAVVNPTGGDVSFSLPSGAFQDLYGIAASGSVQLTANSGLVLVDTGAPRC